MGESHGGEAVRSGRGRRKTAPATAEVWTNPVAFAANAVGEVTAGLALMALLVSADGGYLTILPGMLAMSAGMGLSMTPSTEAVTGSLPSEKQGVASALDDATREFGTAPGVALLGALLSAGYRSSVDGTLPATGATHTALVITAGAGALLLSAVVLVGRRRGRSH